MTTSSADEAYRQRTIARGLNPDERVNEFYGCFSLAEAKESLFGSTRFNHTPVYLTDESEGIRLPVIIDLARPVFVGISKDSEMPDWYFEGWIFDPGSPEVERVRIFVSTMDYTSDLEDDDFFLWQRVTDQPLPFGGLSWSFD